MPEAWSFLTRPMIEQRCWWVLIEGALTQRNATPMGPPENLKWVISNNPATFENMTMRHRCEECDDARRIAIHHTREGLTVAMAEFVQGYLRLENQPPSPFAHRGTS